MGDWGSLPCSAGSDYVSLFLLIEGVVASAAAEFCPAGRSVRRMCNVCVTHEMGFARTVADKIVFMAEGEIVESAAPEEFFSNARTERARQFLSQILGH